MKSLKINALANLTLKILNILFPLITTPYLTRLLNENDFADFNNANTYINLFVPLAAFGIYNYGVREISNNKDNIQKRNYIFSKLFYTGIFTAFAITIFYLLTTINKGVVNPNLYYILGTQILFQFLYIEWINEALENYTFILYKTLVIRIIMLLSIFIFVTEEYDIIPYATIMSATTILNFIISFIYIRKEVTLVFVPYKEILKTIKFLIPVFFLANVNMLYTVLDRVFLTYSNVNLYISYYTLAQTIISTITAVIYGAVSVNIPRLAYFLGKKDVANYNKLLLTGARYYFFFIIPISFGLIILGNHVSFIAFGEKYLASGILITIFAIRNIFFALEAILGQQIIFTKGFEKKLTFFYFIGGIINLSLNFALYIYNILTPTTVLITTIVAELIVIILELIFIKKEIIVDYKNILKEHIKYVLASTSFLPIFFILKKYLDFSLILNTTLIKNLVIVIVCCVISYTTILLIVKDKVLTNILSTIRKNKTTD